MIRNSIITPIKIDEEATIKKIEEYIRRWMDGNNYSGVIMGLSGGVDSALLCALAVRALGKEKVHVYFLRGKNSEADSLDKARAVAGWLGLGLNIGSIEKEMNEKERNAHFFRWLTTVPKFLLPLISNLYFVVVGETPYITVLRKNEIRKNRLKRWVYDNIMSSVETMFDGPCAQRRIVIEKIGKEKNLLVIGAGNKSEDLTGWFTPDGIDNMPCSPINCLYKTQVRQLAEYMGVPDQVLRRKPSADVLKGADDALALGMGFDKIDIILYGIENNLSDRDIALYGPTIPEIRRVRRINHLSAWRREAAPRAV